MSSPRRFAPLFALLTLGLASLAATGCSGDASSSSDGEDEAAFTDDTAEALTDSSIVDWLANTWSDGGFTVSGEPGFKKLHLDHDFTYDYERQRCAPGMVAPCPVETDKGPDRHWAVYHYPNHPERGRMIVFFHGTQAHLVINYQFTPTNDCPQMMHVARHVDFMNGAPHWERVFFNSCG